MIFSLAAGAAAGLGASRGILSLNPAESMRSEPPRVSGRIGLERWTWLWRKLDNYWRMSIRTVWRNGWRSFFTMVGVMFAAGMLIIAFFADDSMDYMLTQHFAFEKSYDYLIRFTEPVKEYEILNISRLEGVVKSEPLLEVPVRVSFGVREEDDLLLGMNPGTTLKTVFNEDGDLLAIPQDGVLMNDMTAKKLGVKVGDQVTIETRMQSGVSQETSLKVLGINHQMIGSGSYVSLKQANQVLRESRIVTAVMLKVDPGKAADIEKELNRMTGVSSIQSRQRELEGFEKQMGYMIYFVGLDDAMHTALTAGTLWSFKGWILALASCLSRLHRQHIEVIPDFDRRRVETTFHCEISFRLAHLLVIMPVIYILFRRTTSLPDASRRVKTDCAT